MEQATIGTRGLAGLVGRELRSLTALLVERNGAQKTPYRSLVGGGYGKRSLHSAPCLRSGV